MAQKDQVLNDNRINVDAGVMVTMPITTYSSLREAHDRAEKYAKHIGEFELNLAGRDKQIKELQDSIAEFQGANLQLNDEREILLTQIKELTASTSKKKTTKSEKEEEVALPTPVKRSHSKK